MTNKFDFDEFDKRIHEYCLAYQGELQQTNDKKGIALLNTNYFQSSLKDLMESVLQSKEARRIPIKLIVSVLEDKKIFSSEEAKQSMKICEIRDLFAHRVNLKSIEEDTEKLLSTIRMEIPHPELEWDGLEMNIELVNDDNEWKKLDLYQKLDLICFELSATAG
jgi:hypothetical protein